MLEDILHLLCGGQKTAIERGCGDGARIHQGCTRDLTLTWLTALTVREVTGGMTDGERVVLRAVGCTEAWSAECGLHTYTVNHELVHRTDTVQLDHDRLGCRVYVKCKLTEGLLTLVRYLLDSIDVLKGTCGTTGDRGLIHADTTIDREGIRECMRCICPRNDLLL